MGHAGESRTILPRACGSHLTNSVLSANFGRTIASAVTGRVRPGAPREHQPSSVRERGLTDDVRAPDAIRQGHMLRLPRCPRAIE